MKIESISDLKSAISTLERQATDQKQLLMEQFNDTCESLKPKNLLHAAVKNTIAASPKLKSRVLIGAASIIAGLVIPIFSKKSLINVSSGIIKKVAAQYSTEIKNGGTAIVKRLINKFVQKKDHD